MLKYVFQRLILLPLTLFCIVLVNFVIINLAPGDPVSITEVSATGEAQRKEKGSASEQETRYLQFREHYGLTLPVLLNMWPSLTKEDVLKAIERLNDKSLEKSVYNDLKRLWGDRSRYILATLLDLTESNPAFQKEALALFIRGATRQAVLGPHLSESDKSWNRRVALDNNFLQKQRFSESDSASQRIQKIAALRNWYDTAKEFYGYEHSSLDRCRVFFFETRFARYFGKVLSLDFGTIRADSQRTVLDEVMKRLKYSLTLAFIPLVFSFFLCQFFGFWMAYARGKAPDYILNIVFLILYAVPVFVLAPFLIENIALPFGFPLGGFQSDEDIYRQMTSWQRLFDISQHIFLPLIAVMYSSLAVSSRLTRTIVLEALRHDYVRTARAKGLSLFRILTVHVGRNVAITTVTGLAGSLGVVLGGSLIVETLFEIDGFGRFFYQAIVERDYNVIMFSTLASSFLSLLGYLLADISYTLLDPRIRL